MRDLFAMWNLYAGYNDSLHRYCLFFGGIPAVYKPGAIFVENNAGPDANEQTSAVWPKVPITWPGSRKYWSDLATNNDLWLTKNHAGVNRFHGWGSDAQWNNGRYVVDFSKVPPGGWAAAVTAAVQAAVAAGWHGVHWDTLAIDLYNWFREMTPSGLVVPAVYASVARDAVSSGTWASNAQAMANALDLLSPTSCQEWSAETDDVAFLSCFDRIKMEGFRFHPVYYSEGDGWSQHAGHEMDWEDWWSGHVWTGSSVLGVQGLEALGVIPVIDAIFDPAWSTEKKAAYAMVAVVTACLSDTALVIHHNLDSRSEPTCQWTAAHDLALQLGDPLASCVHNPDGTWTRAFENGIVMMNPTAVAVGECEAYSALITLGEQVQLQTIFPPGAAEPVRMRIAYLTDVLTTRSGLEQRRQLRERPSGEMTWATGPLQGAEAQQLAGLIYAGQAEAHPVPLWPFPRWLAQNAAVGSTVLNLSPGPGLLWFGSYVALVRSGGAEIRGVASITGDPPTAIQLAEPLETAWPAHSVVYPVATGYLRAQQPQTWHGLSTAGATLTLDIPTLGELILGATDAPPQFLTLEVLDTMPNRAGAEEDTAERLIEVLDPGTGPIWIDSPSDAPTLVRQGFLRTMLSEADVLPFIAFLDRRRGQGVPFLVPSWQQDLTLAAAVSLGATQITVLPCGYPEHFFAIGTGRRMIGVRHPKTGSWYYHEVTAAILYGSVEKLTIDPAAAVAWPVGSLISFLRFCRLDRDDVELEFWRAGATQAELTMRELIPDAGVDIGGE